ncbi:glycosyltransferase [Paracoccus caeni]|uniref:Glycosyltransferase n=1 Tax=Paracoccus caeni TaxID=657651 RepID=A0A934VYB3_9RHOB|nr:glycosyltransferase [Paracoccus caeni]MBK4215822.1 glycosyltransferase [Paracoccus caeni]
MTTNSSHGIFTIGMPVEDRPVFKDWGKNYGASSVSVADANRDLSDYAERHKQFDVKTFVIQEATQLKEVDLRYIREIGGSIATAVRNGDGFTLSQLNIDVEILKIESNDVKSEAEEGAQTDIDCDDFSFFGDGSENATGEISETVITRDEIKVSDITMIVCVRAHDKNPWVLDRLRIIPDIYTSLPNVLIVDFGSELSFSEEIEQICGKNSFQYHFVNDKDTFSAAKARNIGASLAKTELIFFSDIDFFFQSDFFENVARHASDLAAKSNIDMLLMCSAVHVSAQETKKYVKLATLQERSTLLSQVGHKSIYEKFGKSVQYVAPYSNVFLINKTLFSLSGGYDETFRGHGSEDFEFITRLNLYTGHFPMPERTIDDVDGPLKADFFKAKKYTGFRALNTAIALPGQMLSLKAFHLYHPTPEESWRQNNDWKRRKLNAVASKYIDTHERVLEVDYLPREKKRFAFAFTKITGGILLRFGWLGTK